MANSNAPNKQLKYSTDFSFGGVVLQTGTGASIDLTPFLVETSYFEDIFSCAISGNVVLSDSASVINLAGLNGTEFIRIAFQKLSSNNDKYFIDRTFRVYSVSKRVIDSGNNFENYVINFCSEELLLSEQYRISKSYKNKSISDIIKDILNTFLKVGVDIPGTKSVVLEKTYGTYNFVLPNKKIFETINWLCNYAQPSSQNPGADMLFFETNVGYQLNSLQTLFTQPPVAVFTNFPKNLPDNNDDPTILLEEIEIMSLEVMSSFDTLGAASKGTFFNRVITIDPLTRKTSVADFNYNDYFSKSTSLNKASVTTDYKNRHGGYMIDAPPANLQSGVLRMSTVNSNAASTDYIKSKPGSVPGDYFIEKTLPFRVSQLELSRYHRLKMTVPGYNELCVGMVINLQIDTTTAVTTVNKTRNPDPVLSGNYLVSSIRHVITGQTTYISIIEIIKESQIGAYGPIDDTNDVYKALTVGVQT